MKITAGEYEDDFKPVKVEILLESQEELEFLRMLCGLNVTIPDAVAACAPIRHSPDKVKQFATDFLTTVHSKVGKYV